MPPINLLIKPASSNCNLRCKYCFYHSIAESREKDSYGIMNQEVLETLVKKALDYAEGSCTFAFQGGEPTLAGLDFYKRLIELEKKYNHKKLHINNAIQTNGMLINEEWARFLGENKFLVGLSLDGTKEIHDFNRVDPLGKGSFNKVMNTVNLFNRFQVEYNILCVVTNNVARHAGKVYSFFKKNNFKYLQFIPCLDPLGQQPGSNGYSLNSERYANFLKTMFDYWYNDVVKGNMVSIRYFDNLVTMAMGYRAEACGMSGICSCQFVVEADGSVYPCDFYVIDEWYMGNLSNSSLDELSKSDVAVKFVEVSRYIDPKCKACKWFNLCRGGCRRDREPFENGAPILNRFCSAYQEFFDYAGERIFYLARIFASHI